MELVQVSQAFTLSYTAYDQSNSLFVAFDLYDISSGTAVFIERLLATYTIGGTYLSSYTPAANKTYLVIGAVYTNNAYIALNPIYGPNAQCYQTISSSAVTNLNFNYASYDANDSMFIRSFVYDTSTGTPVYVDSVDLSLVEKGVYFGSYQGTAGKSYSVTSIVYTDDTYTIVDTNRAPGSDSFDCIRLSVVVVELANAILTGEYQGATLCLQ
jgi:hypothetical protein